MQKFIEFIEKNLKGEGIKSPVKASASEALILQNLARSYAQGSPSMGVYELLASHYDTASYEHLAHLNDIALLIRAGWVVQTLGAFKSDLKESGLLGLLHSEVSLSSSFLGLLEYGERPLVLPNLSAYEDHLEYLQDQFGRVEIYKELSFLEAGSEAKERLSASLSELENRIKDRINLSKQPIKIEQIFKENSLNSAEQIIFLALLKEEYAGDFDGGRDLNALINLTSSSELERIKNRSLLEEGGRLLEAGLIDYDEVLNAFGSISRNFFITEDVLHSIMHPKDKAGKKSLLASVIKEQEIFELIEPSTSMDDVVLNAATKELLDTILKQTSKKVIDRLSSWGIKRRRGVDAKVLFYGEAGTGKTMSAVSLAKSLKKQVLSFDCSKILSKYVGESEQNVRKIFDVYKDICARTKSEPVLLLNEADQFLSTRVQGFSGSEKMHNQMQNIFLEQIEKFSGVLVATTNFMESLDPAFSRRFDYKIEFKRPGFSERLAIWRRVLPENAVYEDGFSIESLAEYALSGAQIVLVMKNTALKVALREEAIFSLEDFRASITRELNSSFGESKKVGLL
ncbi:ATP-binding protein [Campylobacter sp. 19-13652]|uniref:ATP-binding protein n=1 Tax=Campylobacter sp. 19-13652 TaxID=2840180 RepID=UPI001C76EA5C|nr:ATP-binding protein [Campylobacter sp. 19-13652]BCX78855.1 ATPase AAA [Campylobacter sp. 19-13652]